MNIKLSPLRDKKQDERFLFLVRLTFDQFDSDVVRTFNECIFDLAAGRSLDLVGDFDAILAHGLERFSEIVDAEAHVIDHSAFR